MAKVQKHTFLINLTADGIGLGPDIVIPFSNTNLPEDGIRFHRNTNLLWQVRIQGYDRESQHVAVEVLDYTPEDITEFYTQQPKSPEISLDFSSLS